MGIVDKAKQAAITATVTKALDYLEKDPETNIPKIMEMVDNCLYHIFIPLSIVVRNYSEPIIIQKADRYHPLSCCLF